MGGAREQQENAKFGLHSPPQRRFKGVFDLRGSHCPENRTSFFVLSTSRGLRPGSYTFLSSRDGRRPRRTSRSEPYRSALSLGIAGKTPGRSPLRFGIMRLLASRIPESAVVVVVRGVRAAVFGLSNDRRCLSLFFAGVKAKIGRSVGHTRLRRRRCRNQGSPSDCPPTECVSVGCVVFGELRALFVLVRMPPVLGLCTRDAQAILARTSRTTVFCKKP